ncbi:SRPBCC family protein [Terrabacter sp. AAH1]
MQKLEKRWEARQDGLEPLTVTTSIEIDATVDEIWAFLSDPRSAMLTSPNVIKAFAVPGTPEGEVGGQQCVVMNVGGRMSAHISEIIAVDAPHRVVARWPTMATELLSTTLLTAEQGRSRLTYQIGLRIEQGTRKKREPALRESLDEELERVRAGVESGARFPTD